jgi:hypothetical protein
MHAQFLALLFAGCEHQYLAIPGAVRVDGTPQYTYTGDWGVGAPPTYVVREGDLALSPGESATIDVDLTANVDLDVTEIVFFGFEDNATTLEDHWRYELTEDEIAAGHAEVTFLVTSKRPTREVCSPRVLGTWTCFHLVDEGIRRIGYAGAADTRMSMLGEVPLDISPLREGSPMGTCDLYTIEDCCGGAGGISAVECAWDPSCPCPEGAPEIRVDGDGYRICDCPG